MFVVAQHEARDVARLLRQVDLAIVGGRFSINVRVIYGNEKRIPRRAEEAEVLLIVQFDAENISIFTIQSDCRFVECPASKVVVINRLNKDEVLDRLPENTGRKHTEFCRVESQ